MPLLEICRSNSAMLLDVVRHQSEKTDPLANLGTVLPLLELAGLAPSHRGGTLPNFGSPAVCRHVQTCADVGQDSAATSLTVHA